MTAEVEHQQSEWRKSSLWNIARVLFRNKSSNRDMKTLKQDRRSQRTRRLLRDALIELLLEKRYGDVTIQDILDRANIGRSTFYAHYMDKDDLLTSEMAQIIEQFDAHAFNTSESDNVVLPSLRLFEHVQVEQRLIQAIVRGSGTEVVLKDFRAHLTALIVQKLATRSGVRFPELPPREITARVIAGTFFTLLDWWFETGLRETPQAMDAMFQKLVMPSVRELLKADDEVIEISEK
jgi:AcrR family transcriptional regulator